MTGDSRCHTASVATIPVSDVLRVISKLAQPVPRIVVMGVSGSGKSTVGALLAGCLGVPFVDGDDLHSAANVAKMEAGHALNDADRAPWLGSVSAALAGASGGVVIACSALKRRYRDQILAGAHSAMFVHLTAPKEVLEARLKARGGHFMPAVLLDSQFADLEPPGQDEPVVTVDVAGALPSAD